MTIQVQLESIQTGLTANYVPYFSTTQVLKEAMQNIAYGAIKSGKPAKLYFDPKEEMWAIKDKYIGFGKQNLYIGESEQRDDEQGLGAFGEGWKIFLLGMARKNIRHYVKTVGYTFWGTMEPTPHGPEVLVIHIEPNDQTNGTRVYADVDEEQWLKATESFAILQGIPADVLEKDCIIPDRKNELWVNGVLIEQGNDRNPLNLYYSYNLKQRNLINRDRSHVNTELAYAEIKKLVYAMTEEQIESLTRKAMEGELMEDIVRGPYVPTYGDEQKKVWLGVLAKVHECQPKNLVIPSYNQKVNEQAQKKGLVPLRTPRKWDYEVAYLGIPKADDIIDDQYDVVEEEYSGGRTREEKTAFARVKNKLKKVLCLDRVSYLPEFRYVSSITNPVNGETLHALYDETMEVLYVDTSIMESEFKLINAILPEVVKWKYKCKTSEDFEQKYKEIIISLLGVEL